MATKPEQNRWSKPRCALTVSGLDLEKKIFSASGRGGAFFLTSLFIELITGLDETCPKTLLIVIAQPLDS